MSDRHTPGPWVVDYDNSDDGSGGQWYVSGPARVWFPYSASEDDVRKALANARLIAAAPDLLEASPRAAEMLRVVSAFLRDQQPDGVAHYDDADCDFYCIAADCDAAAEDIEDAIAKACGADFAVRLDAVSPPHGGA